MSYDVFVFDSSKAPRDSKKFIAWWENLIEGDDLMNCHSPESASRVLRNFYDDLKEKFPPINGPDAYELDDSNARQPIEKLSLWKRLLGKKNTDNELLVTDYEFSENLIALTFSWSIAPKAHQEVIKTALRTGVGFFDACGDEGIYHDPDQLRELIA